jgi:hypothetical protein
MTVDEIKNFPSFKNLESLKQLLLMLARGLRVVALNDGL